MISLELLQEHFTHLEPTWLRRWLQQTPTRARLLGLALDNWLAHLGCFDQLTRVALSGELGPLLPTAPRTGVDHVCIVDGRWCTIHGRAYDAQEQRWRSGSERREDPQTVNAVTLISCHLAGLIQRHHALFQEFPPGP